MRRAVSVSLLFFVLAGCEKRTTEPIKVGALLPMTGSGSVYGTYAHNGIDIAVDEVNKQGGVNGTPLQVVYEDSQSQASTGVNAYQKLVAVDHVPAVLTEFSPVVMACGPIASRTRTVLLNAGAQNPLIRKLGPYVFSAIPDANEEAVTMARFAYRKLGLRNIATFAISTDTGVASTQVFTAEFQRLGGRIAASDEHPQGTTDVRAKLTKLAATHPDAIYMVSLARESGVILAQASQLGIKTQWLSYTSFQSPDVVKVAGAGAEGVLYTYPRFDPEHGGDGKQFATKYRERYHTEPEVYAATFYDSMRLLASSMNSGKDGPAIQAALKKAPFNGVAGTIDFRAGNWVTKPLEIRQVKGGAFVTYAVTD